MKLLSLTIRAVQSFHTYTVLKTSGQANIGDTKVWWRTLLLQLETDSDADV